MFVEICNFSVLRIWLKPQNGRQNIPPKHWRISTKPCGHNTEDRVLLKDNVNTRNVVGFSITLLNVVGGTGVYNKLNIFCGLNSRVHRRSMKPWVARHVHLYSCCPRVFKYGRCKCSLHPPRKFRQSGGQWWKAKRVFYVLPENDFKWCKATGTKWPRHRDTSANPLPRKLSIQES